MIILSVWRVHFLNIILNSQQFYLCYGRQNESDLVKIIKSDVEVQQVARDVARHECHVGVLGQGLSNVDCSFELLDLDLGCSEGFNSLVDKLGSLCFGL
jgi:hypothetical protein